MSAINKVIHNWTFHPHGGHWTREILDGDLLKQADKDFSDVVRLLEGVQKNLQSNQFNLVDADDDLSTVIDILKGGQE